MQVISTSPQDVQCKEREKVISQLSAKHESLKPKQCIEANELLIWGFEARKIFF